MTAPSKTDEPKPKRVYAPDFLTELFQNPLEPGYAAAAERKKREGEPTGARKWLNSSVAAVTFIAVGLLLTIAYRQAVADAPENTKQRGELVQQVEKQRSSTDKLQKQADQLGADVARLRDEQLGDAEAAKLRALAASSGLGKVTGNGAKITVGDGPTPVDPVTGEQDDLARVKDSDLQLAVNALWSQGAEAITINGQRLTATSTIRQAGEAILVDLQPVLSPYTVIAIGPDDLSKTFDDSYAGQFFEALDGKYGISYSAKSAKNVTLPAATEFQLRSAVPSTPPPAPSSSRAGSPAPVTSSSEGGR